MTNKLYRKEAIEYKRFYWKGKALLLAGLPAWLVNKHTFAVFFLHAYLFVDFL